MSLQVPICDDGFVHSFGSLSTMQAQAFFDTYGFVVMHDVLEDKDIQDTVKEFSFNFLNGDEHPPDEVLEQLSQEVFA